MHYGIIAIGSRGDVQPYIALALGLKERGHQATIMAYENFKDFVGGYGVEFHPLTGNIQEILYGAEGQKVLKSGRLVDFWRFVQKTIQKTQKQINQDLLFGSESVDVLVTNILGMVWIDCIAEKTSRNWAMVQLSLPSTPTTAFPFAGLDLFNFPPYNFFTYRLVEFLFWRANKRQINEFRVSLGLPRLNRSVIKKIAEDKILNLYCFSPALLTRPDDWDANTLITGFLYLNRKKGESTRKEEIPEGLITWLHSGEKALYIGFGSIPIPDPELFMGILTEMLATTKHRYVFCKGWSLLPIIPVHPNLFVVSSIDHEWLLPRCQAAIIHGGVGTVAACLKAKIPLIILSVIADQPWWGKIIEHKQLGVHIPYKKITKQKLLSAIQIIQNPEIKNRVAELGEQIGQEDGLTSAINALENYFSKKPGA
jgi:sterol 3beta-glucosyltransferase